MKCDNLINVRVERNQVTANSAESYNKTYLLLCSLACDDV